MIISALIGEGMKMTVTKKVKASAVGKSTKSAAKKSEKKKAVPKAAPVKSAVKKSATKKAVKVKPVKPSKPAPKKAIVKGAKTVKAKTAPKKSAASKTSSGKSKAAKSAQVKKSATPVKKAKVQVPAKVTVPSKSAVKVKAKPTKSAVKPVTKSRPAPKGTSTVKRPVVTPAPPAPPKKPVKSLPAEVLKNLRTEMIDERDRLIREIDAQDKITRTNGTGDEDTTPNHGYSIHMAENASEIEAVNTALGLREILAERLMQLDAALEKMDMGDYGICSRCGCGINPERLFAKPMAVFCVACRREIEAERKGARR